MGKKTIFLLYLLFAMTIGLQAQTSRIHGGVAFPSGDFQDEASVGFTVGYRYYNHLSTPGLSVGFGIDFFFNDTNPDEKDRTEKNYSGYDLTHPKFLNFPAMALLNYTHIVNETFGFFGEFGLGLNLSTVTPEKYDRKNSDYQAKYTCTPAINFCFGFEGGVLIQEKFTFSLRYNQLGNYKYRYKETIQSGSNKSVEKGKLSRLPVNHLMLAVGYRF